MTAVEWLVKTLNDKIDYIPIKNWDSLRVIIQQAQEMEKQQIIDANIAGLIYPYVPGKPFGLEIAEKSKAEQYYNETFKKDNK